MSERIDMPDVLSVLCRVLEKYLRVSKQPREFGTEELLYPTEIHVVSVVAALGAVSVTEISEQFGTTRGAASQMVDKLVSKGLLAKRTDPDKRSRLIVEATDKGRLAHAQHMKFHKERDKEFFHFIENLTPEQRRTVLAFLENMDGWMASYLKQVR
ncbi:MAG: MarR family winged helix-turn-helix transcriptional regulator [Desulfovibrionaceae bacterium]